MESFCHLAILYIAASGGSGTGAAAELVGTWRAQIPQEVADVSKKMGLSVPQAQFVFKNDNTFQYSSVAAGAIKVSGGTYQLADHAISLATPNRVWPSGLTADIKEDHTIDFDGLRYVKEAVLSMEGTWKLADDGATKIVFTKDGHFSFKGSAATSKGNYKVEANQVTLIWTEIDGDQVEVGSVHKAFSVGDDGALKIDSYRYVKQ